MSELVVYSFHILTDSPFLRHCTCGPGMPAATHVNHAGELYAIISLPDFGVTRIMSTSTEKWNKNINKDALEKKDLNFLNSL